jgi:hypothetical protein
MRLAFAYVAATLLTVFDDCGNSWSAYDKAHPPVPPPLVQYCHTDPPLLCGGVCTVVTDVMAAMSIDPPPPIPTTPCAAGGPLAQQFETDVQTILVCDPNQNDMQSYVVFPPFFSITPDLVEIGDGCTPPPAPPIWMPLDTYLALAQQLGGPQ